MKQTAVEWFAGEIKGGKLITNQKFEELLQQAKEMERENIEGAFFSGDYYSADYFDANRPHIDPSENYYNEKFKSE